MGNPGKKSSDDDEVEQLLRAAQDDILLKLSIGSHMARASASAAIDPDLDRRFQALKKPQKPAKIDDSMRGAPTKMKAGNNKPDGAAADDDLFARFASLKNSLPSHSDETVNQKATEEDDEEDEVEKVINWAVDAARLEPSLQSDDDDDDDDNDDHNDSGDDDDDHNCGSDRRKKGKRK